MNRHTLAVLALTGLGLVTAASSALAEEVTLPHQGITLNADVELADGKTLADGVILITHGTLAHKDMELVSTLQEVLKDRGLSTLAINLGLGLDNRRGMYDCASPHRHRHTDAVAEIGAWVEWLQGQGAKEIVLMGHSRGGNQTAWYAVEHDDPVIKSVVLLAPMAEVAAEAAPSYQERHGQPLQPLLDKARVLVGEGKGETLLRDTNFLHCEDAAVTAQSFVSYYAPESRRNTVNLLPQINEHVLVIAATEDTFVPGLAAKLEPLADGQRLTLVAVEGADHFFRDLYAEEVADAMEQFLAR
jgi:alpha/beta superfamily hydrolase